MVFRSRKSKRYAAALLLTAVVFIAAIMPTSAQVTPLTTENPRTNSYGMEGTIPAPPPTEGARITAPSGGQTYREPIITVSGVCPTDLLVEILSNGVMAGSTLCENGSFSLQIALFPGTNDLTARVLDDLGQEGPPSNTVTVTYDSAQFNPFGASITLTSSYSRRAVDPGSTLVWPLQLSGGTGPYAFSVDWGDGTGPQLQSEAAAGIINIQHIYKNAGIYRVTIQVVDVNGAAGFLQLIAVANGDAASAIVNTDQQPETIIIQTRVLWIPALAVLLLMLPAFWLGRRHELRAMRRRLEHDAEMVRHLEG